MITLGVFEGFGQVHAARFIGLGDLPGGYVWSQAEAVSADGTVVTGISSGQEGGFVWTAAHGMVPIIEAPPGFTGTFARGISDDGRVIVGTIHSPYATLPVRWTEEGGFTSLGAFNGFAYGASADGSVVVGFVDEAFRWTEAGGLVGLGNLPGGYFESKAYATSDDGSVVVGHGRVYSAIEAFRWTEDQGMVGLGHLLPRGDFSSAEDVSADGSVVVGVSDSEAFRWTEEEGMQGLGKLSAEPSNACAVSGDGSVVVGQAGYYDTPFIWDGVHGMRDLQKTMVNEWGLGPWLTGWDLTFASDVSADGLTIVGTAMNPAGNQEAWLLDLGANSVRLEANGEHPSSNVVTTSDALKLTLAMSPGTGTGVVEWFYAFVVDGRMFWVTPTGLSSEPGSLAIGTPVILDEAVVFDGVLPSGVPVSFVFFLFDGSKVAALDFITVVTD